MLMLMVATTALAAPQKVSVEKRDIKATLRLGVTAAPHLWAQLAAPSSGVVKQVFVDLASRVKKGDKLATVGASGVIAAPFDGVVVSRNALPGVWVREGDALFTVMDPSKMRLELEVAELDAAKISVGAPVTARFEALPSREFAAKVSVIVPMIDARTRRLHADADMDNPSLAVLVHRARHAPGCVGDSAGGGEARRVDRVGHARRRRQDQGDARRRRRRMGGSAVGARADGRGDDREVT
jgi:multidrug efflux pump subunit AcrA (membrane-fusion protein)